MRCCFSCCCINSFEVMQMKRTRPFLSIATGCSAMLILVLDSKTALLGAQKGIELCIYTVIPSLFPFFVISILLTGALSGSSLAMLRPILRFCKMPEGSGNLLTVGPGGGVRCPKQMLSDALAFAAMPVQPLSLECAVRCSRRSGSYGFFGGSTFSQHCLSEICFQEILSPQDVL